MYRQKKKSKYGKDNVCVCMYVCMCMYECVCVCVCVCVCTYMCVYIRLEKLICASRVDIKASR